MDYPRDRSASGGLADNVKQDGEGKLDFILSFMTFLHFGTDSKASNCNAPNFPPSNHGLLLLVGVVHGLVYYDRPVPRLGRTVYEMGSNFGRDWFDQ